MTKILNIAELRSRAFAFVVRETGLSYVEICSHRRSSHLVAARALIVWIARTYGPEFLSFPELGRWLGGRDHTTIMHMWNVVVPRLRAHDADFRLLCERFAGQAAMQPETETCH